MPEGESASCKRHLRFLSSTDTHDVDAPLVHADLFASDRADTVEHCQCIWADALDSCADLFGVAQYTSGWMCAKDEEIVSIAQDIAALGESLTGVNMREGEHLVLALLEGLLDLLNGWLVANGCTELLDLGAVDGQAFGERIAKVARVEHEDILSGLYQVRCGHVPV